MINQKLLLSYQHMQISEEVTFVCEGYADDMACCCELYEAHILLLPFS